MAELASREVMHLQLHLSHCQHCQDPVEALMDVFWSFAKHLHLNAGTLGAGRGCLAAANDNRHDHDERTEHVVWNIANHVHRLKLLRC